MSARERLARIRRSPAARDLKLIAPLLAALAAAVGLFAAVRAMAYSFEHLGGLPTVLIAWLPVGVVVGILIGQFMKQGRGPRA